MAKYLLTDVAIRNAKPRDDGKFYRLSDGDSLYLLVLPTGVKSWQLRYRHDGKPQTASLGKYPRLGLAEARAEAEERRKLAESGKHLTIEKRMAKLLRKAVAAVVFDAFAQQWAQDEARRQKWDPRYRAEVEASIDKHL